jgi:hypothetical protein
LRYTLKHITTIFVFVLLHTCLLGQDTGKLQKAKDSIALRAKAAHKDSLKRDSIRKDSLRKVFLHRDSLRRDSLKQDSAYIATFLQNLDNDDSVSSTSPVANIADSLTDTLKRDSLEAGIQSPPKKVLPKKEVIKLMQGTKRNIASQDIVFYILMFLVLLLGLIRTSFPKYFDSIFSLSFQATFRQTQTKEQMAQNFFPAFMLNVLFVFCGGLFITLFASFNQWTVIPFWELFIYSTGILLIIYLSKYIVISFTGWVFNAKDAATEYRFVVFLINKLLAILLIPLLFLIAYADVGVKQICITIAICLAIFSLAVRYLVSLARIRKNLSITAFHFFIYLCAVEIAPLLVIYKMLFQQTSNR